MINAQSASPYNPNIVPGTPQVQPQNVVVPPTPNDTPISPQQPPRKGLSKNLKVALGSLLLLIAIIGGSVGYYLNQQNQDVRQQADEPKPTSTPIVRPPETTAPTLPTATCLKTAYVDPGTGAVDNLVETKSFNSTQGILFRISVTKQDDKSVPLVVTDDFRPFINAGYEFVSAEVRDPNRSCSPDVNFNQDNPGFYRCSWNGAAQGQTMVLYIRLRATTAYLVEPEKISATNNVTVMPVELSGDERPSEELTAPGDDTSGRNAPTGTTNNCSTTVMIPGNTGVVPTTNPSTLDISCTNTAYENNSANTEAKYTINALNPKTTFAPGDIVVYQVSVRNNSINPVTITVPTGEGNAASYLTFLDSTCGASAYNATTKTLSCPALNFQNTDAKPGTFATLSHTFRMRISNDAPNVSIPLTVTSTSQPVVISSTDSYIRNCSSTIQIQGTSTETAPTATPAVGCNQICTTNSDCSNPDHICSNVGEGQNVCRLSSNVNSASCTSAISQTTQQPSLPEELPQTGATDIATWAKAGLGALGLGMMLLLLL